MGTIFAVRAFRRLYAAQVASLAGTGLLTVALALLAFDIAGDDAARVLATALAIKMVAYVGMAPVTRAFFEKYSRTSVLVGSDAIRLGMVALLPIVSSTWQIYLLVFALQTASATFTPTFTAIIPRILPDTDDYTHAVAASRAAYDLEALASPMIAALLLTVIPHSGLFGVAALGFGVSALLVIGSRRAIEATANKPAPDTATQTSNITRELWNKTTAGFRIMLANSIFRGLVAANLATAAATALVMVCTITYVHTALRLDAAVLAVTLAVFGCGSLAATLTFPRLAATAGVIRVAAVGSALCVLTPALAAAMITRPSVVGLLAVWAALGAATALVNTAAPRIIRDHTDATTRDDVFTAQFSASHAAYLLCYPLAGLLTVTTALWIAPLALSGVAALGVAGMWLSWRRRRTESNIPAGASPTISSSPAPVPLS